MTFYKKLIIQIYYDIITLHIFDLNRIKNVIFTASSLILVNNLVLY
jgi:hypothetical protein